MRLRRCRALLSLHLSCVVVGIKPAAESGDLEVAGKLLFLPSLDMGRVARSGTMADEGPDIDRVGGGDTEFGRA
ncbi:hypothetical protein [Sneathiella sp.]|uniref:hypothetical protein n=1 Tax=Sneathiella sp. TaxID=1964365 RepID=UPI0025D77554|nr:hypothetical protein [Sneathiella sp.]